MISLYNQAPYPIAVIIWLACILPLLYFLFRYYKKIDIWTNLFFIFLIIDLTIMLLIKSLEEFQVLLNLIQFLRVISVVLLLFMIITITKAGFKKAWQNQATKKLIIFSGILLLISMALMIIGLLLAKIK